MTPGWTAQTEKGSVGRYRTDLRFGTSGTRTMAPSDTSSSNDVCPHRSRSRYGMTGSLMGIPARDWPGLPLVSRGPGIRRARDSEDGETSTPTTEVRCWSPRLTASDEADILDTPTVTSGRGRPWKTGEEISCYSSWSYKNPMSCYSEVGNCRLEPGTGLGPWRLAFSGPSFGCLAARDPKYIESTSDGSTNRKASRSSLLGIEDSWCDVSVFTHRVTPKPPAFWVFGQSDLVSMVLLDVAGMARTI